jgi:hypothetical protein
MLRGESASSAWLVQQFLSIHFPCGIIAGTDCLWARGLQIAGYKLVLPSWLRFLAAMAPDIFDVVTAALTGPIQGIHEMRKMIVATLRCR